VGFRVSRHALEEMQRRGIATEVLDSLLEGPEQVVVEREGRQALQSRVRFPDGRIYLVRAIVATDVDPPVVVTVYQTTRIAKCWRQSP
jgi:hypothetical protein